MTVDRDTFRQALGQWPSGVTVVTTLVDGEPHGMTASSFSSVSLDPPLVSVCVARHAASHDRIRNAGVFAISILAKDQVEAGMRFAGMLDVEDRFAGVATSTAATGAPHLDAALAWLDCRVWAAHDGGDHTIFVGEVLAAGAADGRAPLLYHDRAWGQFADVLPEAVHLAPPHAPSGAAVLADAFGTGAPRDADAVVADVRTAMADEPTAVVLDDASATATPLQVRQVLQALGSVVGRTPVVLRVGDGPLASANLLTALKSGVREFQAGDGWVPAATADLLFAGLDLEVASPADTTP